VTAMRDAWTRPGVFAVADGVHRLVLPLPGDGLKAVNVYVLEDGDGFALVDTGWKHPGLLEALTDGFAALGASLSDLTTIICTHSHYDHYGLAAHLRSLSGAPVLLGEHERLNLSVTLDREQWELDRANRRGHLIAHGALGLAEALDSADVTFEEIRSRGFTAPPDRWLADGEQVSVGGRVLEARLTPGHSRGHLMFFDATGGVLFAGDHVLPHITPSIGFEAFSDGHALEAFLASLRASRDLPAEVVLPGHGPVFADLAGRVDELLAHHDTRLAACVEILAGGGRPVPAARVAERLTWTRHERSFESLNLFNRMLATTETITHLELLAVRGDVVRSEDGETVVFSVQCRDS
jgi:glyoxylase-like metal-dependent hydrolase (beta-lactamase superfamily II)